MKESEGSSRAPGILQPEKSLGRGLRESPERAKGSGYPGTTVTPPELSVFLLTWGPGHLALI